MKAKTLLFAALASMALVAVDRFTKIVALAHISAGAFPFLGFPRLTLYKNFNAVFSLPIPSAVVIAVSVVVILAVTAVIAVSVLRNRRIEALGFLLILIGAASNLFDRIHYGFVIDVVEVIPRSVWNIADAMILVGVLVIFWNASRRSG